MPPEEHLQRDGEKQLCCLLRSQPAPSPCWTHWPTAFLSRKTELGVFEGGGGTNSVPSTTGVSLVGGICTDDVRGDISISLKGRISPICWELPREQQNPKSPEQDRGLGCILANTHFSCQFSWSSPVPPGAPIFPASICHPPWKSLSLGKDVALLQAQAVLAGDSCGMQA